MMHFAKMYSGKWKRACRTVFELTTVQCWIMTKNNIMEHNLYSYEHHLFKPANGICCIAIPKNFILYSALGFIRVLSVATKIRRLNAIWIPFKMRKSNRYSLNSSHNSSITSHGERTHTHTHTRCAIFLFHFMNISFRRTFR